MDQLNKKEFIEIMNSLFKHFPLFEVILIEHSCYDQPVFKFITGPLKDVVIQDFEQNEIMESPLGEEFTRFQITPILISNPNNTDFTKEENIQALGDFYAFVQKMMS